MTVNTALFGSIDVPEKEILRMPRGPYGFDEHRSFVLLEKEDQGVTFRWLQSVTDKTPCFVVFDPNDIVMDYKPDVEPADLKALGCSRADELQFYAIAVVPEDYMKATVNLKSPFALNLKTGAAMQVILANTDYPIRFPLVSEPELQQAQ